MGYCSVCGKEIEQTVGMCEECKAKSYENEDYMDALLQNMGTVEDDSLQKFKEKIASKSAFNKDKEHTKEIDQEPVVTDMPELRESEPIELTEIEDLPEMNIDEIPELDIEDLSGLGMDELTDMVEEIPELQLGDISGEDESDIGIDIQEYVDKSELQDSESNPDTEEEEKSETHFEDMVSDMNVEDILNMTSDMDESPDGIDMNIDELPDIIPELHMDDAAEAADIDVGTEADIEAANEEAVNEETANEETVNEETAVEETTDTDNMETEQLIEDITDSEPVMADAIDTDATEAEVEVQSGELPELSMEEDISTATDSEQSNDVLSETDVPESEETVDDVLDEMMSMEEKGDALEAMFENSTNMGDTNGELDDVNMDEFDLDALLEATDDIEVPSVDDMMNAAGQDEIDALLADEGNADTADTTPELVEEVSSDDVLSDDTSADEIDLEDIDLMSLLSGDDDLEMLDEDLSLEDNNEPAASESQSKSSASSGEEVLIDNDLLSVESDGQNVGDVLSDALSAISPGQGEGGGDVSELLDNEKGGSKKKKKKKGGVFSKLFGNIVDEEEIKKAKQAKESEEAAKKQKEEDEQKKKEQAELDKQEKQAAKEAKAKEKEEKKQIKAAEKAAKKEEKALKALEEETEIEGRINKAGAAIVFFVLGLMAVFIFFGTKMFSYSNSISNAQTYFDNGKYAESYRELLGVDIKEADQVLYQKVVTVMYVYKQLEAYDVYYKESRYPEAVDSLLKGIREYQKYLPDAVELDISSDFESVKSQIVREMETEFGITEDMAKEINGITDSAEYSRRVYELSQHLASTGL